jgi:hypothetical protein
LRRFNDDQGLGLEPPIFGGDMTPSEHTPTGQSMVDALYRGDAVGAKKIFTDYINVTKDPAEQKKRANSVRSSVQSATSIGQPLELLATVGFVNLIILQGIEIKQGRIVIFQSTAFAVIMP